jgi:hypothetical protein
VAQADGPALARERRLAIDGTAEIAVSFKRELGHGHFDSADQKMLDQIVPHLQASARIAECVFDAETADWVYDHGGVTTSGGSPRAAAEASESQYDRSTSISLASDSLSPR